MRDRFRSFDSKITFFAFADIITAVSGMLIFITLLLATDLGRPTDNSSSANTEIEQQITEALTQQLRLNEENRHLQDLLAVANTAPDAGKLQTDIAKLRLQVSAEKQSHASIADQLSQSAANIAARDKALGLTDLKLTIQRTIQETHAIAQQETNARSDMAGLDRQVSVLQSKLLKLKELDGQLWLIPDKTATTKEPILVTVASTGLIVEKFDHPEQRKHWDESESLGGLKAYLRNAAPTDQYVVFLIRPSGIALFQEASKSVRDLGFEIGFDALEENRQIHFTSPPPIEETIPSVPKTLPIPTNSTTRTVIPVPQSNAIPITKSTTPGTPPVAAGVPSTPAKNENWWQKFLRWLGLR